MTWWVCPSRLKRGMLVFSPVILANRSAPLLARRSPRGEKANAVTASLCRLPRSWATEPSDNCHTLSSPDLEGSPPPVANRVPSGLKANAFTRSAKAGASDVPAKVCRRNHGRAVWMRLTPSGNAAKNSSSLRATKASGAPWPTAKVLTALPISGCHRVHNPSAPTVNSAPPEGDTAALWKGWDLDRFH